MADGVSTRSGTSSSCCSSFSWSGLTARGRGRGLLPGLLGASSGMLEFVAALFEGGPLPRYGDADDGLRPRPGIRSQATREACSRPERSFSRTPGSRPAAGGFEETARWLLPSTAAARFDAIVVPATPSSSRGRFPDSGYYLLQSGRPDDRQIASACSSTAPSSGSGPSPRTVMPTRSASRCAPSGRTSSSILAPTTTSPIRPGGATFGRRGRTTRSRSTAWINPRCWGRFCGAPGRRPASSNGHQRLAEAASPGSTMVTRACRRRSGIVARSRSTAARGPSRFATSSTRAARTRSKSASTRHPAWPSTGQGTVYR